MIRALITGITGQDGSYLAELLLDKGYEEHGIVRRSSIFNRDRIDHLYQEPHLPGTSFSLHYGDLSDAGQLTSLIYNIKPDEIYNLGAQSHARVSFDLPPSTLEMSQPWGQLAFSRQSEKAASKQNFIKLQVAKCSAAPPHHKTKTAHFTPNPHTQPPRSTHIGWLKTTVKATISSLAMVSCSTMNHPEEENPLLPGKSHSVLLG